MNLAFVNRLAQNGYHKASVRNTRFEPEKSFTRWCQLVKTRNDAEIEKTFGSVRKAALAETSGATGGYAIPRQFSTRILDVIAENSFIRPQATVVPMTSAECTLPDIDAETTPAAAGTSPFLGGMVLSWGVEASTIAETEPLFRAVNLKAWDLIGIVITSNQFLQDIGPEGDEYLINLFGKAVSYAQEFAFLQGTGTADKMPLGMVNSPATLTQTRAGGNHIAQADIAGMADQLLPRSWGAAIWACSPTALQDIMKTTGFVPNQINLDFLVEALTGKKYPYACAGTLLSHPLLVTEKLPKIGTQGDLMLFDPSMYVIGDRMELDVTISDQASSATFTKLQSVIRIWSRVDGRPRLGGPVTLQDTTTKVSAYVALK